ncbi:hypothetical protein H5410_015069 [Solanum commersonii]|uniref:Uncharacterized protein n=1 Tax=Solanum commersonii TaxID=4109 RepID=A0A9J5ZSJ5_SOLCO|nr:hypothetical protein H5410_015069 [Solanum commersonii]
MISTNQFQIGSINSGLYMVPLYVLDEFSHRILNSLDYEVIQKDPEGKIHGQEILDLRNIIIDKYHNTDRSKPRVDDLNLFKQIAKLHMKK